MKILPKPGNGAVFFTSERIYFFATTYDSFSDVSSDTGHSSSAYIFLNDSINTFMGQEICK